MREAVPATKPVPHELLVNAAGGLMTTPSDYVRFMLLMMDGAGANAVADQRAVAPRDAVAAAR